MRYHRSFFFFLIPLRKHATMLPSINSFPFYLKKKKRNLRNGKAYIGISSNPRSIVNQLFWRCLKTMLISFPALVPAESGTFLCSLFLTMELRLPLLRFSLAQRLVVASLLADSSCVHYFLLSFWIWTSTVIWMLLDLLFSFVSSDNFLLPSTLLQLR